MKTRLLLVLLIVSSYTFAQNWSQVGATQFTSNFVINAEVAFDNSGTPFVVYEVPSNNGIYVEKFDGTNWVQVGSGAISTENYNNLTIKVNPVTNEPWVVLKSNAGGTASNLDIFSFDGSTWVDRGQNVGVSLYSYGIQLQFNASGNPRIAGVISASGIVAGRKPVFYTYNATTTSWDNTVGSTAAGNQTRIDFYDYNHYISADSDSNVRKYTFPSTVGYQQHFTGGPQLRNISGISGTDFFAVNRMDNTTIYTRNGNAGASQPIGADAITNGILKLRKSATDNKYYIMFEETDNSIVFQKYDTGFDTWTLLPNIGLTTTATDFFIKMEMNAVDGNMYVLYKDGGRMSLKKFNIQAPLNLARIYVDADATGNANGSSWADAYTNPQDALTNIYINTTEIWIAEGTYKPHVSDRAKSFVFNTVNLSVYGGFDGTETTLADRDLTANHHTILSGDLNGNDTGVNVAGTNRLDNSKTVVQILANSITLDGLFVNDGHAISGSSTLDTNAAGIYITNTTTSFTLKNCQINNNVARSGAGIFFWNANNATIAIENCIINNNLNLFATLYFLVYTNNKTLDVTITNSLFINNESKDIGGIGQGITASAAWIRAYTPSSTVTTTISNCTFSNNKDIGTFSGSERGPLALGRRTAGNSTHNATINNSIFYGNTGTGGAITKSINKGHMLLANTVSVYNAIGEDSFSNLVYLTNTIDANPLFVDASNNDFTLQSGSPAIDTGDNSKVPAGIVADLLQNDRIYNTTVDMGCYEFGASPVLVVNQVGAVLEYTVYPNPTNAMININLEETLEKVEIFNMLGKKVIENNETSIDVSNLPKGVYLIKITTESGLNSTKRFIKR